MGKLCGVRRAVWAIRAAGLHVVGDRRLSIRRCPRHLMTMIGCLP